MKFLILFFAILCLFFRSKAQTSTTTYTALPPDSVIRSPERGFANHDYNYHAANPTYLNLAKLIALKQNNYSLLYILFYLNFPNYLTSPIPSNVMNDISSTLNMVRTAGFKTVVRFGYNSNSSDVGHIDPPVNVVIQHIQQLGPLLKQNADIIYVMQTGFVGVFGEWHDSDNFGKGDRTAMSPANYADRKNVSDTLLSVLPSSRMIQQRYPDLKQRMYGQTGAIADSDAYSGSSVSRIGHHNQCFCSDANDVGTYITKPANLTYPYLAQETKYVAMGGETCGVSSPYSDCPNAQSQLATFHWSYMDDSSDMSSWPALTNYKTQGCYTTIQNSLGYRFQLVSSVFPTNAKANSVITFQINLNNTGYAALINPRTVYLVLKNSASQYSFPLKSDPRYWLPGKVVINESFNLGAVNPGSYNLYLNLPDQAPTLSSIVDYSIRFANVGTWDSVTGLNNLTQTINITN